MDATAIPIDAWTQAVIVVLFAVILGLFLAEMRRQQREWREFLSDSDKRWQNWLAERDADICQSLRAITESLQELRAMLLSHDQHVDERVQAVRKIAQKQTQDAEGPGRLR